MDLRQLRYFATVAELENFTVAASRLNVAQSALSRQIGNLEAELGVSLFLRTGKRIQLAPAGSRLRPAVLKLLMDADALRGLALAEDECIVGDVAIGAHPSDGQFIFPHLTQKMRRLYPGVRVDLVQELTSPLQEHLLRGCLDAAVLTFPDTLPGFDLAVLFREQIFFLAPSNDCPSDLRDECDAADVIGLPLILPHRPHRERYAYEQLAKRSGQHLTVAAEVDGIPLMKLLAKQGVGSLILPRTAIDSELTDPDWRAIKLRDSFINRYLATRSSRQPSRALSATLSALQDTVHHLRDCGIAS